MTCYHLRAAARRTESGACHRTAGEGAVGARPREGCCPKLQTTWFMGRYGNPFGGRSHATIASRRVFLARSEVPTLNRWPINTRKRFCRPRPPSNCGFDFYVSTNTASTAAYGGRESVRYVRARVSGARARARALDPRLTPHPSAAAVAIISALINGEPPTESVLPPAVG